MAINKKGEFFRHSLMAIVMVCVLIIMIIVFFLISLVAPIFLDVSDTISGSFEQAAESDGNLSYYTNLSVGSVNRTAQANSWIFGYGVLFIIVISFLGSAFTVRSHPWVMPAWIIFMLVLEFASVYMSVAYQDIKGSSAYLTSIYSASGLNDLAMTFLPVIVGGLMLLGGVFLLVLSREKEEIYQ